MLTGKDPGGFSRHVYRQGGGRGRTIRFLGRDLQLVYRPIVVTETDSSVITVIRLRAGLPENRLQGSDRGRYFPPPNPDQFWDPTSFLSKGHQD